MKARSEQRRNVSVDRTTCGSEQHSDAACAKNAPNYGNWYDTVRPLTLWDLPEAEPPQDREIERTGGIGVQSGPRPHDAGDDLSRESLPLGEMVAACYAQVLVNLTVPGLQERVFTYRVPESDALVAQVGQPVLVPFGGQREVTGFILMLSDSHDGTHALRDIAEILDEDPLFDADYADFIRWVADYYATPLPQVLACALPSGLAQRNRKKVFYGEAPENAAFPSGLKPGELPAASRLLMLLKRNDKGYSPQYLAGQLNLPMKKMNLLLSRLKASGAVRVESERAAMATVKTVRWARLNPEALEGAVLSGRHQEIVTLLREAPEGMLWRDLLEKARTTPPTLKKLAELGVLRIEEIRESDIPGQAEAVTKERPEFSLSLAQQEAMEAVLQGDADYPYLLYGITGSGKTEVYIALTREMLAQGRSVMMMAPEIALTSQIARRFIAHFGQEQVAVWHSQLSESEKADAWRKLHRGELKILIGARSAIWTPMRDLGLILIDEEHEGSFKQDSPEPRYSAKTLAMERSRRTGAKVVLGSATPEVAVFHEARLRQRVLHLPERFGGRRLAEARIVDMKSEAARGGVRGQISKILEGELESNLNAGEQSIIMLNRRGFYTTIQCNVCDHIFQCASCDIALTYHRAGDRVCCHYCGFRDESPQYCPVCAGMDLCRSGVGTQRIEAEILRKFPEARVLRLDSDILRRKNAYSEILGAFASGGADILIGTQIVAKGLDVANVTLVGVIGGDASFALPDYKSAERGFQLLTQVAGRAGRGQKPGRVIIQSIQPTHPVLLHAQRQDYPAFFEDEIAQREACGFPPFSRLYRLIASSENEERAQRFMETAAMRLTALLRNIVPADTVAEGGAPFALMGPAPCVLPRIRNRYRYHLLVKNFSGAEGHRCITAFYKQVMAGRLPEDLHFLLDVDAQSLL